jgi:hypothetical protein
MTTATEPTAYLIPGAFIDSNARGVVTFARDVVGDERDDGAAPGKTSARGSAGWAACAPTIRR